MLFVPFGFFLSFINSSNKKSVFKIMLMGLFLSLFIEVVQYVVPMGRSIDVDDLILNTAGSYLGYEIWKIINKFFNMFTLKETKLKHQQ
ncbi:VanZ like protein [Paenisporosarcina sp. OV554]|nr:VanZ like protein [Paenisporosarcina sp. OV554]